jgi:hypothetical protein
MVLLNTRACSALTCALIGKTSATEPALQFDQVLIHGIITQAQLSNYDCQTMNIPIIFLIHIYPDIKEVDDAIQNE